MLCRFYTKSFGWRRVPPGSLRLGMMNSRSEIKNRSKRHQLAPVWQPEKDSNPHKQSQSLVCYHYTNPLCGISLNDRRLLYQNNDICQPFSRKFFSKTRRALWPAGKLLKSPGFSAHQFLQYSPPRCLRESSVRCRKAYLLPPHHQVPML